MPNLLKKISFPLVFFIFVFSAWANDFIAPESKYLLTNWSSEEGLPQNTVSSVLQTDDGYLWVATLGGLAKFDGFRFTVFTPNNTPALKDNRFISLYEDNEGLLWINSEYGRTYFYENGNFQSLNIPETPFYLAEKDQDGNIWGFNDNEVKKYSFNQENKEVSLINSYKVSFPANSKISNLLVLPRELIVTSIDRLVTRIDRDSGKILNKNDLVADEHVVAAKKNLKNEVLFITNKSVGILANSAYSRIYEHKKEVGYNEIRIAVDNEQNFWTIDRSSIKKLSQFNYSEEILPKQKDFEAISMTIDDEGHFWVGTPGKGLFRLKERKVFNHGMILEDNVLGVNSVFQDSRGKMWIGSKSLFTLTQGIAKTEWDSRISASGENVNSINEDQNGSIWFSTSTQIGKISDNQITGVRIGEMLPQQSPVTSIFFDRDGNSWFGSNSGLTKKNGDELTLFTTEKGLINNWILFVTELKDGTIAIGTIGGLSLLKNGSFTNFTNENGLSNNSVRHILEDDQGILWIGTYGGGINRLAAGKIVHISSQSGLPEDIASSILLDDSNNFWILGNRGVYSVSRQMLNDYADGKIKNVIASVYDTNDGMIVSEGNGICQYSGWKAQNGNLWFAMIHGVIEIDPKIRQKKPPKVYIEKVLIGNEPADNSQALDLSYDQNNIQIEYTGINLANSANIQFRYKLEGFDRDWNFVGERRTAYFPFLPSGNYLFKVQAISADGIWSEKDDSLVIVVKAPFWRRGWFLALLITGFIVMVATFYQWRLRNLEAKRQQQRKFSEQLIDAHEAERKRIASDLHDGLGQNLLVIKNWASIALREVNQPDDIHKRLTEIEDLALHAIEDTRNISSNLMPLNLQRFGLSETLIAMVKKISKATGIEIIYEIEKIDGLVSEKTELSIYRIVQECLNNIVKHAETKSALVSIKQQEKEIRLLISDAGKSFDINKLDKVGVQKAGLGIYNLVERVKLMNGSIKFESIPGSGTKININLPIQ